MLGSETPGLFFLQQHVLNTSPKASLTGFRIAMEAIGVARDGKMVKSGNKKLLSKILSTAV